MPGSAGFSWDPAITVAPGGTVYASYMHQDSTHVYPIVAASFDHGATYPQVSSITPPVSGNLCSPAGSCAYSAGDFNAVIQKSTDGGKTWGPITPLRRRPQHRFRRRAVRDLGYPTSGGDIGWLSCSTDGGRRWSRPVRVTPDTGDAVHIVQSAGGRPWPGDTFGIAVLPGGPGTRLAMSWGSAVGSSQDPEIYSSVVSLPG
jgi:hypothetical protein